VAGEIGGRAWRAMRAQVPRRRAYDPAHVTDAGGMHARIRQLSDPHADVDAFLEQVDDTVDEQRRHGHPGMPPQVFDHARHHENAAKQFGRGDREMPARFGMHPRGGVIGLAHVGDNAPGTLEVTHSRVGRPHETGGPSEEFHAEPPFERRDRARGRRRRQLQFARAPSKTLRLGNGCEHSHQV